MASNIGGEEAGPPSDFGTGTSAGVEGARGVEDTVSGALNAPPVEGSFLDRTRTQAGRFVTRAEEIFDDARGAVELIVGSQIRRDDESLPKPPEEPKA